MKLGEACFLKSGKNITAQEICDSPKAGLFPCFGGNGLRGYVDRYNYEGKYNLIGRQGALCGNVNQATGRFYATEHAVVVTPLIPLDDDWLYYALIGMDLNQYHTGAAQPGLNIDILNNIEITIPNIIDQRCQAILLSKLSKLIAMRKTEIIRLDDLVKARFVEMFENHGYPVQRLSAVCTKITDGTHKTPNYQEDGITFISAKNIINGKLDFSDIKHITKNEYEEIQKRCNTELGDILMAKSGSLGLVAIVETDEPLGLFESLAVLKYDRSKIDGVFLKEQLSSKTTQNVLMSGVKGVAVKHLHLNVIGETPIIVPPMEIQRLFSTFAVQVDKLKAAIRRALAETQLLFDSLMQKYFG